MLFCKLKALLFTLAQSSRLCILSSRESYSPLRVHVARNSIDGVNNYISVLSPPGYPLRDGRETYDMCFGLR